MFKDHCAHAPVLFQYVFHEVWYPWEVIQMVLGAAVRLERKEDEIDKIQIFL